MKHKLIEKAEERHEAAARGLTAAVREAFPVGMLLFVELSTHLIGVKVTGHSEAWWYSPGMIIGVNTITGKNRRFYTSDIVS